MEQKQVNSRNIIFLLSLLFLHNVAHARISSYIIRLFLFSWFFFFLDHPLIPLPCGFQGKEFLVILLTGFFQRMSYLMPVSFLTSCFTDICLVYPRLHISDSAIPCYQTAVSGSIEFHIWWQLLLASIISKNNKGVKRHSYHNPFLILNIFTFSLMTDTAFCVPICCHQ